MKTDSRTYRRTIKRLTQAAKSLRDLSRVPAALPRPGSQAYLYPKVVDGDMHKDIKERTERWEEADAKRLDKPLLSWFADAVVNDAPRRR